MNLYKAWAPPGVWGPWVQVDRVCGTMMKVRELGFSSESNAPSPFEAQIKYSLGNEDKLDSTVCPGSWKIGFGMNCSTVKVRFRSYSLGQNVLISVS